MPPTAHTISPSNRSVEDLASTTTFRIVDSPIGPLTIAGRDGMVTHLTMDDQSHPPASRHTWTADPTGFATVVDQLHDYFAGDRHSFDVPLALEGTDFQLQVWQALEDIPYGETRSYGQIAAAKGNTLLNYAGVRPHLLPYVVDMNPAKQNKYLPGSRIPIVNEAHLKANRPSQTA